MLVSSCTSTSRNWDGSAALGNESSVQDPVGVPRERDRKPCTSASTTPPASPTSRSSPTNGPRPRSSSSNERSPGSPAVAFGSVRSSPTMARPTGHTCGSPGARRIASSIFAPVPTGPAPTAKPNGSSKPCCANGPTPRRIAAQPTELVHCPPGSTTTTTNDHTAPSVTRHPPAGFTPTDQRQWELQLARSARAVLPDDLGRVLVVAQAAVA